MASDSIFSRRKSALRWPSPRYILAALATFLLLYAGQAPAASDDDTAGSQPEQLHIKGWESIEIDAEARKMEMTKAVISIGSLEMTADLYSIFWKESLAGLSSMNPEDIEKCIVKGDVNIVYENSVVTAQELVYDSAEQTLVITGEPVILESKGSSVTIPEFRFINFTPETVQTIFARPQDTANTL